VTAIELTHWLQVERRSEHPYPGGTRYRMQIKCRPDAHPERSPPKEPFQHRGALLNGALVVDAGDSLWRTPARPPARDQKYKSGERPGDPDIEKNALAENRRTNSDESAQRAGERHRRGQEVGSVASTS